MSTQDQFRSEVRRVVLRYAEYQLCWRFVRNMRIYGALYVTLKPTLSGKNCWCTHTTRRAPSRHYRDARVYGQAATAMHDNIYTHPPSAIVYIPWISHKVGIATANPMAYPSPISTAARCCCPSMQQIEALLGVFHLKVWAELCLDQGLVDRFFHSREDFQCPRLRHAGDEQIRSVSSLWHHRKYRNRLVRLPEKENSVQSCAQSL